MNDAPGPENDQPLRPGPAWLGPKASEGEIPATRRLVGGG